MTDRNSQLIHIKSSFLYIIPWNQMYCFFILSIIYNTKLFLFYIFGKFYNLILKRVISVSSYNLGETLKHSLLQIREDQEQSDHPPNKISHSRGPPESGQSPGLSPNCLSFQSQPAGEYPAGGLPQQPRPSIRPCKVLAPFCAQTHISSCDLGETLKHSCYNTERTKK